VIWYSNREKWKDRAWVSTLGCGPTAFLFHDGSRNAPLGHLIQWYATTWQTFVCEVVDR